MQLDYDALKYNHPSKRTLVYGRKGMVCTSQPLAAQIGLDILKKGGNAIDAAIATAAAMTVLEPTSNGIGGDAFALVWANGKLTGLNASGPSVEGLTLEEVRALHGETMPSNGWVTVTVPGAPAAWAELSKKYGKLPFADLLQPAIDYAENGYPLSPTVAIQWEMAYKRYSEKLTDDCFMPWFDTFAQGGKIPSVGEMVYLKDHAQTLREIAETQSESFYRGDLADRIDQYSRDSGGYIRKSDLEKYQPEWVDPISTDYRGYTVYEIPPNGHGITALMALNIFENYGASKTNDVESVHHQVESMKLAFTDAKHYITDPRFMKVSSEQLLSKEYAKERYSLIGEEALEPMHGDPSSGGTIYLCTADSEGNMVSFIQSNYSGFGSGIVVPGTGIALQNRGSNFSLDEESDNCLAPEKKPYHTIIPGFLFKDGKPIGPFGVMGGFMQPQGHFQTIVNSIDLHMNPQQALDAPRWQWTGGKRVEVESDFPYAKELKERGHEIVVVENNIGMGRGQIIWRDDEGVLIGATEKRADGYVAVW